MERFALHAVAILTLAACDQPTRPVAPRSPQADLVVGPSSQYTITDLGTLGGTFSQGLHLNATGSVVGSSTTASAMSTRSYGLPRAG